MENDRLNEIRELNPDYDISMHELDVCVGDNQYRLMYYVYVQHKESGIGVYGDKDFDMQSINIQFNCNDIASSLKAQRDKIVFTSSSWWSTPVRSDVFPLTETESYYKQQSPNLV